MIAIYSWSTKWSLEILSALSNFRLGKAGRMNHSGVRERCRWGCSCPGPRSAKASAWSGGCSEGACRGQGFSRVDVRVARAITWPGRAPSRSASLNFAGRPRRRSTANTWKT